MSIPISKPPSANDMNISFLGEGVNLTPETKKPNSSKLSLFHGRNTSDPLTPPPTNMSTLRIEDETGKLYTSTIKSRSIESDREHTSSLSTLTSRVPENSATASQINTVDAVYQRPFNDATDNTVRHNNPKKIYNLRDERQTLLPTENSSASSSTRKYIREAYVINKHILRSANDALQNDGSEHTYLRSNSWWERNTKWNPAMIISTLAVTGAVSASLILDIMKGGDNALFQRSGSIIVSWTMFVAFITLRKRSEKLAAYELVIEATNEKLSKGENVKLMDLFEDMENVRFTERKVKRSASSSDWIILVIGIIGTLIWGYGDLFFK